MWASEPLWLQKRCHKYTKTLHVHQYGRTLGNVRFTKKEYVRWDRPYCCSHRCQNRYFLSNIKSLYIFLEISSCNKRSFVSDNFFLFQQSELFWSSILRVSYVFDIIYRLAFYISIRRSTCISSDKVKGLTFIEPLFLRLLHNDAIVVCTLTQTIKIRS